MPITSERLEALLTEHEQCLHAVAEAADLVAMIFHDNERDASFRLEEVTAIVKRLNASLPFNIARIERDWIRRTAKRNIWHREKMRQKRRESGVPERVQVNTLDEAKQYYAQTHGLDHSMTPEQKAEYATFEAQLPTTPPEAPRRQAEVTGINIKPKGEIK